MYTILNGSPPFSGNTEQEVIQKIKEGKYVNNPNLSKDAKDLMSLMLQIDPKNRISASEAYAHPWIINNINVEPLDDKIKYNLIKFQIKNKMRSIFGNLLSNFAINTKYE